MEDRMSSKGLQPGGPLAVHEAGVPITTQDEKICRDSPAMTEILSPYDLIPGDCAGGAARDRAPQ